jgi:superfamily II DNA or RNA helicase
LATFNEFLLSLDADAGKRGKQFEHFIKWFLKNDPEWATQVDQVWLWDEYPDSWGRDCGIDLVFKHKNGENWAVQAKCYAPTISITKADVDSFISESNRDGIDKRLLIATTDLIGANAKQVCDAQDKAVTRFLLSHFEDADIEYPATLDDLPKAKRKDKPKPREHQIEAIAAVALNFKDVDRGQLIMACGTGKTFTTLWIKEKLGVESTLVLLPSLGLLSQTLHEWTLAANEEFQVLCVCSDESVGKKGSDEAVHSIADLAFPVTSDAGAIKAFLSSSGKKVIFSTYQSSPLIAEAQSDKTVPAFDLAIADEAHRCAGKVSGDFSTILDGEKIRAKKRLFTTATPRTYSSSVKKAAEDRGVEVVGMDDEAVFGKQLFALNFGEAIKRGLLTDYRVVIIGVDDPTISAWIENRELLKAESDIEMDAESLAAQVGLLKAIKDYDLHRLISFHSRVSRAEDFSQDIHKVLGWIDEKHKPRGELKSDFVSGEMPTDKRRRKLAQLKGLKDSERGLLTNARCLSEGVDVPSLDGVAFIDPRSSQIDIIQAVGRAIRLSDNKKAGIIVLPVFIGQSDNPEQALEEGNFKPIWDVLNALKSHDDVLADELNQIRTGLGRKGGGKVDADAFSKITIDLPVGINNSFSDGLRTLLVEQMTSSWEFWFGLLEKYSEDQMDCSIPQQFITYDGHKLGKWVSHQREKKESLSSDRKKRLESLQGWSWDPIQDQWGIGYIALKEYCEEHGDCLVPAKFITKDGYKLGAWVRNQRIQKAVVLADRKIKLEGLRGWSWDQLELKWETGYLTLKKYMEERGDSLVLSTFVTSDGFKLGSWVATQRANKGSLSSDRKKRLESLQNWSWDPLQDKWVVGYLALKEYSEEHGDCLVPLRYITRKGYKLGSWVNIQRQIMQEGQLLSDRKIKLEGLRGWSWDQREMQWEAGFLALNKYAEENGDYSVPSTFITSDGFKLGNWVVVQRVRKESLSSDRKKRLESLQGWSWSAVEKKWETGYLALKEYSEEQGDCLVPAKFITKDGYKLGAWVALQRTNIKIITPERRAALENLEGWAWNKIETQWEVGYLALKKYIEDNGDCLVPIIFITKDGIKLGQWVANQRRQRDKLTAPRIKKLESLKSWLWNTKDGQWENSYKALKEYSEERGNCLVSQKYITKDGFKLGQWVSDQRKRVENTSPERKKKLESLKGWTWDASRIKRN